MSEMGRHVQDYLRLRRALGFKLAREGVILPELVDYLHAAGARTVTTDLAISWAQLPQGTEPIYWSKRLGAARGFAKYLRTIDPATEVPPPAVFGARQHRRAPYLWSQTDIARLLHAAGQVRPPLRGATYQALFGLLAVSGLRISEALGLGDDDVDLATGTLTIDQAKFGRSRLVPLHPSTTTALGSYAAGRDRARPGTRAGIFFVADRGTPLAYSSVHQVFAELTTALGLRANDARPRMHDLRHSFAVRTLIDWHRSGQDIEGRMPALSTYLGHVAPASTYWYLSAAPELMTLAAQRLQDRFGGQP